MVRKLRILFVPALASLMVAGFTAPRAAKAQSPIKRFSAEFKNFNGTETETDAAVPGVLVYSKTLTFGSDTNTVYVTMSAVGDTHNGNAEWLNCTVDGNPCNPGFGGAAGAPAGWIAVSKHFNYDATCNGGLGCGFTGSGDGGGGNGDMHDNSIYYTWCSPIAPGVHTIQINMAAAPSNGASFLTGDNHVFFEAAHFYIDGSKPVAGSACVATTSGVAAAEVKPGQGQ
jgi:hypothetical protein